MKPVSGASDAGEQRPDPGADDGEEVLWEGKPAIIAGIDWRTTKYRLTRRQLQISHSGLRKKKTERIPLTDVESVSVAQGLTEQSAGVGDVVVNVRGGDQFILEDVYHFQRVKDMIQEAASEQAWPAGPGSPR